MKRTMEIKFPDVSTMEQSEWVISKLVIFILCMRLFQEIDSSNEFGIVRGIKHSSHLADDCQPEATLIDGGINERTATIEITSQRGCGLDSIVEFFIEQL